MIDTTSSIVGPLEIVTPTQGSVVTRKQAKAHCRVDDSFHEEDLQFDEWIKAATDMCENDISGHRQFLTAVYDVPISEWWCGMLKIPRPPLAEVVSLFYYDTDETLQTLDSSSYVVRTPTKQPGTIELAPDEIWPDVSCQRSYPIRIRFRCGYGNAAAVPAIAKQAILMTILQLYKRCLDHESLQAIANFLEMNLGYGSYA